MRLREAGRMMKVILICIPHTDREEWDLVHSGLLDPSFCKAVALDDIKALISNKE